MSQDILAQEEATTEPVSAPSVTNTSKVATYNIAERQKLIDATEVPTFGWQADLYSDVQILNNALRKLNIDHRIDGPKPSKNEQLLRMYKLLNHIAKTTQRIICVINSKGGAGKTPVATGLAATMQWSIKTICGIIDANENNGTTGKRLGISRDGLLLLRGAMANLDAISNLNKMSMRLGKHDQTGLIALLSDPSATNDRFTLEQFTKLANVFFGNVHSGVLDTGNGNEHSANEGSFQFADVALFSAWAPKADSFEGLVSSMDAYYKLGYEDKVRSSYIVISATDKKDTKDKFYKMLENLVGELVEDEPGSTVNRDRKMKELGITHDNMFLIPFSEYIQGSVTGTVVPAVDMDPRVTGVDTLIAFAELALAIFLREVPSRDENQKFNDILNARKKNESASSSLDERKKKAIQELVELSGSPQAAGMDIFLAFPDKKE